MEVSSVAPRIMVVAGHLWPLAAQVAIELKVVGFEVAAVAPPKHFIRKVRAISNCYTYSPRAPLRSVARAIKNWRPDFLVCVDDTGVKTLHRLHKRLSMAVRNAKTGALVRLLEKSLGDPAAFQVTAQRSTFVALATAAGVRCPRTVTVSDEPALERELLSAKFPIVLKTDGTWSGAGVRIVSSPALALEAFRHLVKPTSWLRIFKRSLVGMSLEPLIDRLSQRGRSVDLQQYIAGRPAHCALVCSNGNILAAICVEVLEVMYKNGPATVVRVINSPEMIAAAATMIKRLGLAGFCGFDFVLDETNQAWLIELNPRAIPACHAIPGRHSDFLKTIFFQLSGKVAPQEPDPPPSGMITLFPQEWLRSRDSDYFWTCYHNVPWHEPEFIRACLEMEPIRTQDGT